MYFFILMLLFLYIFFVYFFRFSEFKVDSGSGRLNCLSVSALVAFEMEHFLWWTFTGFSQNYWFHWVVRYFSFHGRLVDGWWVEGPADLRRMCDICENLVNMCVLFNLLYYLINFFFFIYSFLLTIISFCAFRVFHSVTEFTRCVVSQNW